MSIHNNIDTINGILEQASSRHMFNTTQEGISYELGFLMGLLAKLMDDDNFVKGAINHKLERNDKHKK